MDPAFGTFPLVGLSRYLSPARFVSDLALQGILTAAELREAVGVGSSTAYDTRLALIEEVAERDLTRFLGQSLTNSDRTDYYVGWAPRLVLSARKTADAATVKYHDGDGVEQTVDAADWIEDDTDWRPIISFTDDFEQPDTDTKRINPVSVTYKSGLDAWDATHVGELAMRLHVRTLFERTGGLGRGGQQGRPTIFSLQSSVVSDDVADLLAEYTIA